MKGIVTGATGGIGQAVCRRLQEAGYVPLTLTSRLENPDAVEKEVAALLREHADIAFLINAAGIGVFEPMETISLATIQKLIAVNLTAPVILTKLLLPALKQHGGTIVNITSIEALRASKYSALYSASKAGLRHFSHALFEEVRKSNVRVCTINPDVTDTPFFDNNRLKFRPMEGEEYAINPDEIAQAVLTVLQSQSAITDITLRPQKIGIRKR